MIDILICNEMDAIPIAALYKELMTEIIVKTVGDEQLFPKEDAAPLCRQLISSGQYTVLKAVDLESAGIVGFLSMCESFSLYANGSYGVIQELYVREEFRSHGTGKSLIAFAVNFARSKDWKRLEVATPQLPEFERSLAFYEREGFLITGGCKLKLLLAN
ncbi:GNAT family N-acetyltransferase [Paenibacillus sp. NPDC056579]|uniref:GNAT family N-acetyltransferase n=1 Tax=Paenibacillus sp. NPDC056579 TaxID=3345871 RepID=UPI00368FB029